MARSPLLGHLINHPEHNQSKKVKHGSESGEAQSSHRQQREEQWWLQPQFQCDHCHKKFIRNDVLLTHIRVDHQVKPTEDARLVEEAQMVENESKFNCNKCQFQGNSEDILKNHIEVTKHHDSFQCRNCNKEFTEFPDLMKHRKADHGRKCKKFPKCDRGDDCWYQHPDTPMETNQTPSVVVAPASSEHGCRVCSDKFDNKPSLMKHRKTAHAATVSVCRESMNGSCPRGDNKCWYRHQTNLEASPQQVQAQPQGVPNIQSFVDFPQAPHLQEPPGQTSNQEFMVQMLHMMAQMVKNNIKT